MKILMVINIDIICMDIYCEELLTLTKSIASIWHLQA